jgi:hypothetical protein
MLGATRAGEDEVSRLRALAPAMVLALIACQTRTVTVTQEVTREVQVEVTRLVTQQSSPETQATPAQSLTPQLESTTVLPYPDAPLCPDSGEIHDNSLFHTLWDSTRGCHYDHEHGQNPFTPEVAATFPVFDLRALVGGVGVGHTNPSSPMENTHKHGGFKWQVTIPHPNGCAGHEGSSTGVDASTIQYHAFGDYSIEFESRVHSVAALMRQCTVENPTDYGYVYLVQHVDYGQRVSGYQGSIFPYPDNPQPSYDSADAPYFTIDCIGATCESKTPTRELILASDANTSTTWTSDPRHLAGSGSHLFELLFRARDTYQVLDRGDVEHPFHFVWLCSNDEGLTYVAMPGCRYNNSTTTVHEINGTIPGEWDNLSGFDTDARVGRITADGYVTRFGELNTSCTASAPDCHPIKLVQAFVGYYGSTLIPDKGIQFRPAGLPERDIYFCGRQVCTEGDPDAKSSGWIGQNN